MKDIEEERVRGFLIKSTDDSGRIWNRRPKFPIVRPQRKVSTDSNSVQVQLKRKDFSVDEEAPFGSIQEQVVSLKTSSNVTRQPKRK